MTCKDLVETLVDYLEGDLEVAANQRCDEHLAECPRCAEYLDGYRKALTAARLATGTTEGEVPPDLASRLIERVLRPRSK